MMIPYCVPGAARKHGVQDGALRARFVKGPAAPKPS